MKTNANQHPHLPLLVLQRWKVVSGPLRVACGRSSRHAVATTCSLWQPTLGCYRQSTAGASRGSPRLRRPRREVARPAAVTRLGATLSSTCHRLRCSPTKSTGWSSITKTRTRRRVRKFGLKWCLTTENVPSERAGRVFFAITAVFPRPARGSVKDWNSFVNPPGHLVPPPGLEPGTKGL